MASYNVVDIGPVTYFFSYDTCVAFRTATERYRTDENWSRTTQKHMSAMGCKEWPRLSEIDFAIKKANAGRLSDQEYNEMVMEASNEHCRADSPA